MRNVPVVVVHLQDAMSTAGEDVKIFMPSPLLLLPTVRRMGRLLFIDCMALTTATTTKANWDGWRVKKIGRRQCHGMPPLLFLLSVFVGSKVYVKKKAGEKAKRGEVEEGNKKRS